MFRACFAKLTQKWPVKKTVYKMLPGNVSLCPWFLLFQNRSHSQWLAIFHHRQGLAMILRIRQPEPAPPSSHLGYLASCVPRAIAPLVAPSALLLLPPCDMRHASLLQFNFSSPESLLSQIGNRQNTVSRVLFQKRELTEFCGKLDEFCQNKLGEFALAHS